MVGLSQSRLGESHRGHVAYTQAVILRKKEANALILKCYCPAKEGCLGYVNRPVRPSARPPEISLHERMSSSPNTFIRPA